MNERQSKLRSELHRIAEDVGCWERIANAPGTPPTIKDEKRAKAVEGRNRAQDIIAEAETEFGEDEAAHLMRIFNGYQNHTVETRRFNQPE